MKYTPRLPVSEVNATPRSALKEFVLLAGALTGIVVGVYLVLGLAVDLIVPRLSVDFEADSPARSSPPLESKPGRTEHERWVQTLTDRLPDQQLRRPALPPEDSRAGKSGRQRPCPLPGGHVVVFSGLLNTVTSENELAFILAHEMGHFQHRDHLRGAGRAPTCWWPISGRAVRAEQRHQRSARLPPQHHGAELFPRPGDGGRRVRAGCAAVRLRPRGRGDRLFRKIPTSQDPGRFGHYFASHPENQRRISHLEALIGQKGYETGVKKPVGDLAKTP
ncbi:MAG: M48 family metalloprotease [Desulfomicrobium escambiense]|nr:M48 family metalloprotease [Desulfomicrobium escambiense]